MARAFVVGNGTILVAGDRHGSLLEFYAPHFAPEHQLLRRPARIGLTLDGSFLWLDETFDASVAPCEDAPIADLTLRGTSLPFEAWIETFVDARLPVVVRRVEVTNKDDRAHDLRLAFHYDFRLSAVTREAAARDAATGGVLHHGGRRALLMNAIGPEGSGVPLVTVSGDGGAADSLLGIPIPLPAGASAMVTTWIAAAGSVPEARRLDAEARRWNAPGLLARTRGYWSLWTSAGVRDEGDLPEDAKALYAGSLVTLRLLQSPSGAFLSGLEAPPDSTVPEGRWCRLRDAAPAADALGRAGYGSAARRYFEFAARSAREAGELYSVLEADGAPAPAPEHALKALDGVALHLWAAARHFERERDAEFLASIYGDSLVPAAERLASSADPVLGLPVATDVWDERWGGHAAVAAATRGGLRAAARLAAFFGETARARAWTSAADQIARAVARTLYDPERGRFLRSVSIEAGERRLDPTLDASLLWLGLIDDLEPEDPRVRATVEAVRGVLWARNGAGGLARHEADALGPMRPIERIGTLGGTSGSAMGGAGPSAVTPTLWLAQHAIRAARKTQDLEGARILLLWTAARAQGTGLVPERLDVESGGAAGASPCLAATAAYVTTVLDYVERARLLGRCDRCGEPAPARRLRRALTPRSDSLPGIVAHL